jgi:Na+/H+ antiporter NhaA
MSLFIGLLAFADAEREAATKLAVLVASLLSALAGALVLASGAPAARTPSRRSG